jgi:hypothetical protein
VVSFTVMSVMLSLVGRQANCHSNRFCTERVSVSSSSSRRRSIGLDRLLHPGLLRRHREVHAELESAVVGEISGVEQGRPMYRGQNPDRGYASAHHFAFVS